MSERAIGRERRARMERERITKLENFKQATVTGGVEVASFTLSDDTRSSALETATKLGFQLVLRRTYNNTGSVWRVIAVRS